MSAFDNKRLIIKYDELPEVNGILIESIYGRMITAHDGENLMGDAGGRKPDYYILYPYFSSDKSFKVKELPKAIAELFGDQVVNNKNHYITRMWFRSRDSGNGGFIDQSAQFDGAGGFSYYRTKRWKDSYEDSTFEGEGFDKKINAVLGKKFKAKELPESFDVEYPCTYLRNEGGLNYPDVKCSGWRWSHGSPYVSYDKGKNMRVFSEHLNAHLYITRVEDEELEEGDEELISVTFPHGHDKKPDQFCNITSWSDTKKEDPNGIVRFKILKIDNKNNWSYKVAAMLNDREQFKRECHNTFYRLVRISFIDK